MRPLLLHAAALAVLVLAGLPVQAQTLPHGFELVYSQSFEAPSSLDDLIFTDARAWAHSAEDGALELRGGSEYAPPHRSPLNIALLRDLVVGDFVLEIEAKQTGREYGHRDLCFFFGFEAPDRFYYSHVATSPDPRAHNVFLVDRAARAPTTEVPERGVDWGTDVWRTIRLERLDGVIRVFFDGALILESRDTTIAAGRLGVGSFDDTGRFRNLRVWARETTPAGPPPF